MSDDISWKNTKLNKIRHIVTQRVWRAKPDTNLCKSLEPGHQRGIYSPPAPFPYHKNKKMPQSQKKRKQQARKRKGRTTTLRSTLLFVELTFVLKGTVKLQGFVTINNYFSRFTVELVVTWSPPNSQKWYKRAINPSKQNLKWALEMERQAYEKSKFGPTWVWQIVM